MTSIDPHSSTPTVIPGLWRHKDGRPHDPGIRIHVGTRNVFVHNRDVLTLANSLADYLAGSRTR